MSHSEKYIFTLHLVWPSNINELSKQTQIYSIYIYVAQIYSYSSSFQNERAVFKQGLRTRLIFKNHTHTCFLPPLCVLRWAGLHPNWEWKAWLTPSLSCPAAPLFCLGYREVQGVGTLTYNAEASSLYVIPVTKAGTYSQAGLRRWKPLKRRTLRLLSISLQTFGVTCGIRLPAVWALKIFFAILWVLEYIFQNCSVTGCEDRFLLGMYILNCDFHHLVISLCTRSCASYLDGALQYFTW